MVGRGRPRTRRGSRRRRSTRCGPRARAWSVAGLTRRPPCRTQGRPPPRRPGGFDARGGRALGRAPTCRAVPGCARDARRVAHDLGEDRQRDLLGVRAPMASPAGVCSAPARRRAPRAHRAPPRRARGSRRAPRRARPPRAPRAARASSSRPCEATTTAAASGRARGSRRRDLAAAASRAELRAGRRRSASSPTHEHHAAPAGAARGRSRARRRSGTGCAPSPRPRRRARRLARAAIRSSSGSPVSSTRSACRRTEASAHDSADEALDRPVAEHERACRPASPLVGRWARTTVAAHERRPLGGQRLGAPASSAAIMRRLRPPLHRRPHARGRARHVDVAHAERRERVDHRVDDRRRRADRRPTRRCPWRRSGGAATASRSRRSPSRAPRARVGSR